MKTKLLILFTTAIIVACSALLGYSAGKNSAKISTVYFPVGGNWGVSRAYDPQNKCYAQWERQTNFWKWSRLDTKATEKWLNEICGYTDPKKVVEWNEHLESLGESYWTNFSFNIPFEFIYSPILD